MQRNSPLETAPAQKNAQGEEPPALGDSSEQSAQAGQPDYENLRLIGRGSYGEVWLARSHDGNYRAVKVVCRATFGDDRPYEREYAGLKKFEPISRSYDNQVQILQVGRNDSAGYFYYVMELADDASSPSPPAAEGRRYAGQISGDLATLIPSTYTPRTLAYELKQKGRLPFKECLQIGLVLAAALENLHQHGLIHRDVKPSNIIFVGGVPKLADIGLVTGVDASLSYVGTEGFVPPEGAGTPQADIYSLGKVLYEISTGKNRFEFPSLPTSLAELPNPKALLELNAVIAKSCHAKPDQRYRSARELYVDLAKLKRGKSILKQRLIAKRLRRIAVVAGSGLIVGLVLFLFSLIFPRDREMSDRSFPARASQVAKGKKWRPVPAARKLAEAERIISAAYPDAFEGKNAEAGLQAARELMRNGERITDPPMLFGHYKLASDLAAEAGDYSLALSAIEKLATSFEVDAIRIKLIVLEKCSTYATSPSGYKSLAMLCMNVAEEAISQGDFESAEKLNLMARLEAHASGDDVTRSRAQDLKERINELRGRK